MLSESVSDLTFVSDAYTNNVGTSIEISIEFTIVNGVEDIVDILYFSRKM